jgi:hypothetical protein
MAGGKPKVKERKQERKESARQPDPQAGKELLLLWAILGEGGGKDISRAALEGKGMLPNDDKKARDGLEKRGLITAESRTTRDEQGRPVRGIWMTVTKAGLAWAEENLAAVPARSQAAAPILQRWLGRLSVLLQARNMKIMEFLEPRRSGASTAYGSLADTPAGALHEDSPAVTLRTDSSPLNGDYNALRARIRKAYLELTGGRLNTRALLRELRQKLKDVERRALDEALKKMQSEEEATLYRLDNQVEVTEADRAAAIHFGGEPRHILWIER